MMTIALLTAADAERMHEILVAAFPRPWSAAQVVDELGALDRIYVGDQDGVAGGQVIDDELHVLTVAVRPAARGRGHGRRLVQALLEQARTRGAVSATLEVGASNHPARALYTRLGFVEEGIRPAYYGDDDAVIMWKRPQPEGRG